MYQKLLHLNLPIGEEPRASDMFGWANTGSRLNDGNMDLHQFFAELHPNLVYKFTYLKYLDLV